MWSQKIFAFFCDAFRPPFRNAHWIILIYVALSVIYNADSNFNRWVLPDTDDHIRFVQVFNWLDGQSWFDLSLPHLYPQHIITMHWARLPDIPLAGMILLLKGIKEFFQLDWTRQSMAMMTAFAIPLVLLGFLLVLVRQSARSLLGRNYAGIACLMTPLCLQLMFQFMPMRVDHHAYVIIFAVIAFFCLQNILLNVRPLRMATLAALALALGMWNGAEILPMLVAFGIALTFFMVFSCRRTVIVGPLFGLCLTVFCGCLLFLSRAPDQIFSIEYDTFSFFYVIIAAFAVFYFTLLFLISLAIENRAILASAAFFIAMTVLWGFLYYFPDFILGPYAKTNPLLNVLFFPNIREAVPFIQTWSDLGDSFGESSKNIIGLGLHHIATRLFIPIVGIFTCAYGVLRKNTSSRQRALWTLHFFFILGFTLLVFFWQVRLLPYTQIFSIAPAVWLMLHYFKSLPKHYSGRQLFAWEWLTVFSLTLFPVIIVPGILTQSKFMPDMLFYLGRGVQSPCMNRTAIISALREMRESSGKASTILAPMDYTPEFMFYTGHNYIAAPYHRNDRGIIDMTSFFRSRQEDLAARQVAKRLDLDYIVMCKESFFQSTLYPDAQKYTVLVTTDKIEERIDESLLPELSLGARLVNGKVPHWLKRMPIPFEVNFLLFEVNKKLLGQPTRYPKEKPPTE